MARFKGENTKVTAAKQKKAQVKIEKEAKENALKESKLAEEWSKGAKKPGKQEERAQKEAEKKAKKLELELLKKAEDEELSKIKPKNKIDNKPPQNFQARNVDDAIDLMNLVNTKEEDGLLNSKKGIEKHPERRHKAAFALYEAKEMPKLKLENKGLRHTQLQQLLWKNWQKSIENPFNQVSISYKASKEEELKVLEMEKLKLEDRLKIE